MPKHKRCPQNTFWLQLWHTFTYHHTHRHQRPEKGTGESRADDQQSSREGYRDLPQHKDHHILLPRRDIHPDTIQRVNADISKGFTRLPNVYLAHHPSISIRELYDHVHIRKDKVNVFAKTLKDTAWGRQTTSTPLKTTHLPTHTIQIQTPSRVRVYSGKPFANYV